MVVVEVVSVSESMFLVSPNMQGRNLAPLGRSREGELRNAHRRVELKVMDTTWNTIIREHYKHTKSRQ